MVEKTRKLITLEAENEFDKWLEADRQVEANREAAKLSKLLAERMRNNIANIKKEDILQVDVIAGQAQAAYNESLYHQILALANMERITAGGFNAGLVPASCAAALRMRRAVSFLERFRRSVRRLPERLYPMNRLLPGGVGQQCRSV